MPHYRAEILTIFGSYFGRNDDFINSFWNLLTFRTAKTSTYLKGHTGKNFFKATKYLSPQFFLTPNLENYSHKILNKQKITSVGRIILLRSKFAFLVLAFSQGGSGVIQFSSGRVLQHKSCQFVTHVQLKSMTTGPVTRK